MATLVHEQRRLPALNIIALLAAAPFRLEFAVRLALICVLTVLVAEVYQTPEPALTAYVGFFVVKPDRMTSIILSLVLLLLISIIIGLLFLIVTLIVDSIFWRVVSMALLSFGLLFVGSASKLKPLAPIIALITAYALSLLGSIQIGELATRGFLYAWLFVGIPASISIIVNLLLGVSPKTLAEQAIAERLRATASLLQQQRSKAAEHDFQRLKTDGAAEIINWVGKAKIEKTAPKPFIAALHQAAVSIMPLMLVCEAFAMSSASKPSREALVATLERMAAIFKAGGYPRDIEVESGFHENDGLAAEIALLLRRFTEPALPSLPETKAPKGGFFQPDAFTNPAHVHFALKVTAAAMTCYLTYSVLDWQGIHTSLITCYIVALGSLAETVEKLTLRIAGCLVGAALGTASIVYVMPSVTSIGGLLFVVFCGALVAAWVAAGSPRIAYAGFQIGFAFFLCVVQGASPAFDLAIARDRVIGILLGNLAIYAAFRFLWPVTIARRVDPAFAAWGRAMAAMFEGRDRVGRLSALSQAQHSLSAVEQDLQLTLYEPELLRPSQSWVEARAALAARLQKLQVDLFLAAQNAQARSAALAAKLEELLRCFQLGKEDVLAANDIEACLTELEPLLQGTQESAGRHAQ